MHKWRWINCKSYRKNLAYYPSFYQILINDDQNLDDKDSLYDENLGLKE